MNLGPPIMYILLSTNIQNILWKIEKRSMKIEVMNPIALMNG